MDYFKQLSFKQASVVKLIGRYCRVDDIIGMNSPYHYRHKVQAAFGKIGGQVVSGDLQPVFAAQGPENTGKTLTSLAALHELGLIEEQNGHWLPVPVSTKQDLASAPILQKLAAAVK